MSRHPDFPTSWMVPCLDSYGRDRHLEIRLVHDMVALIVPGTPARLNADGLDDLIADLKVIRNEIRGRS